MCKSKLCGHTHKTTPIYSIHMHHNLPFFIKNRPKMAIFCQQLSYLAKKYQF